MSVSEDRCIKDLGFATEMALFLSRTLATCIPPVFYHWRLEIFAGIHFLISIAMHHYSAA